MRRWQKCCCCSALTMFGYDDNNWQLITVKHNAFLNDFIGDDDSNDLCITDALLKSTVINTSATITITIISLCILYEVFVEELIQTKY